MKIRILILSVLLTVLTASAADITGKWIAQVPGMMGRKTERVFTFQVAGEKLTGTVTDLQVSQATFEEKGKAPMTGTLKTQNGDPMQITDGKITGDSIAFATVSQGFMGEMKTEYKGKIAGDEIKFTAEQGGGMGGGMGGGPGGPGGGGPQEFVAKKVK
jgi:hypothetical protein